MILKAGVLFTVTVVSLVAGMTTTGCRARIGHFCQLRCCHPSSYKYGCWFTLNATGNGLTRLLCVYLNASTTTGLNHTDRLVATINSSTELCLTLEIESWTRNDTAYVCQLGTQWSYVKNTVEENIVEKPVPATVSAVMSDERPFSPAATVLLTIFLLLVVLSSVGYLVMERYSSLERRGFWVVPTDSVPPSLISRCLWSFASFWWGPRRWWRVDLSETAPGCTLRGEHGVPTGTEGRFTPMSV